MTSIEELASFAAALDIRCLPPDVVRKAKLCVLDTVSACLTIGSTDGSATALALVDPVEGQGTGRIFGRRERTDAERAAFVNAVSAAATIRTDTHPASASHPGMVVVPAVLAAGEAAGAKGSAILAGVVAGYEFMIRLGLAVITPALAAIFRPTGLLGPGPAALGVAAATGLERSKTVRAVALACHGAAGFNEWVHAGTNEHIYHGGFSARHAISCVRLARAGAEGAASLLEGPSGLLAGFSALGRAGRVTAGLGERFLILDIVHKPAPACIFAQSPVQAAAALVAVHRPRPNEIERVEICTAANAIGFPGCNNSGPFADPPSAQQSIQFGVAAVMVAGEVQDASWGRPSDPAINALAARCRLVVDESAAAGRQPVRLTVRMQGGDTLSSDIPDFRSMSEDEVVARYRRSAGPVLGVAKAERALNAIMHLEELADVNAVTSLLVPT